MSGFHLVRELSLLTDGRLVPARWAELQAKATLPPARFLGSESLHLDYLYLRNYPSPHPVPEFPPGVNTAGPVDPEPDQSRRPRTRPIDLRLCLPTRRPTSKPLGRRIRRVSRGYQSTRDQHVAARAVRRLDANASRCLLRLSLCFPSSSHSSRARRRSRILPLRPVSQYNYRRFQPWFERETSFGWSSREQYWDELMEEARMELSRQPADTRPGTHRDRRERQGGLRQRSQVRRWARGRMREGTVHRHARRAADRPGLVQLSLVGCCCRPFRFSLLLRSHAR